MQVGGEERIGELLARFEELQRFDHRFAAFDPAMVRRVGAIPTEYVYYFYDGRRYVDEVARAGASRGQDVLRLNTELLAAVAKAFDDGVDAAWSAYEMLLGVRRDTYMRTDTRATAGRARRAPGGPRGARPGSAAAQIGGYEGLALQVIDGLSGGGQREVIVNIRNGASLGFLDPDDIVEVPALVDRRRRVPAAGARAAASGPGPGRASERVRAGRCRGRDER